MDHQETGEHILGDQRPDETEDAERSRVPERRADANADRNMEVDVEAGAKANNDNGIDNVQGRDEAEEEYEASDESDDEGLEEEDRELIEENLGPRGFRRLQQKALYEENKGEQEAGGRPETTSHTEYIGTEEEEDDERTIARKRVAPEELEKLFAEEEEEEESKERLQPSADVTQRKPYGHGQEKRHLLGRNLETEEGEEENEDEDELADFIEEEGEELERDVGTREMDPTATSALARKKASSQYLAEAFGSSHLPMRVIRDILEVFGDGTDYLGLVNDDESVAETETEAEADAEAIEEEQGRGESENKNGDEDRQRSKRLTAKKAHVLATHAPDLEALILGTDLPESLVRRDGVDRPPPKDEIELAEEAAWIMLRWQGDRQLATKFRDVAPEALQAVIASVLRLLRNDGLEVPTVATHRKELFQHLLTLNDLWAIWDADEQWKLFSQQRTIAFQRLAEYEQEWKEKEDLGTDHDNRVGVKDETSVMREVLKAADCLGTIELVAEYLKDRRQIRADSVARTHDQFAQSISLSMGHFLENVSQQTILHALSPTTPSSLPADLSPSVLLTALVRRLGRHPYGVQYLRALLEPMAMVNVRPTERGLQEIDSFHELAPIKYVTGKPLTAFVEDHFLWIIKGTSLGLLTYELVFAGDEVLIDQLASLFDAQMGEDGGKEEETVPQPNIDTTNPSLSLSSIRRQALRRAMEELIIPRVRRELITRLRTESERWVAVAAQYALQDRLMVAPYDPAIAGHSSPTRGEAVRVLACTWAEAEQSLTEEMLRRRPAPTVCVAVVDAMGRVLEQARFAWTTTLKDEAPDRLLDLLETWSPSCILVAGRSLGTRLLHDRLQSLRPPPSIPRKGNSKIASSLTFPPVQYAEDDVARVYAASARGQRDWPDTTPSQRYIISVARRFLCPLAEYTAAGENELLALEMPGAGGIGLVNLVSREVRLKYLTRAAINVVNLVGVDMTEAPRDWLVRSPLTYVCGLGPVRTRQLLRDINKHLPDNRLTRRTQLLRLVPTRVYANCASFLRVRPQRKRSASTEENDPLDETRIHPEHYGLARKMAADAMEMELTDPTGWDGQTGDDPVGSEAVRRVMREPGRLDDLLLEAYAQELVRRGLPSKHLTLLDIKAELQKPYADLRTPCAPPSPAVLFSQLTGENERTLWVGAPVRVTVGGRANSTNSSPLFLGHLSSGLPALLVEGGERRASGWRPGQVLSGRVLAINLELLEVEVAVGRDVERLPGTPRQPLDRYYDHELGRSAASTERPKVGVTPTEQRPRRPLIAQGHPAWRDVSRQVAESILKDALLGEVILRPSGSRGAGHVSLTWKMDDAQGQVALFQHLDIEERGPRQLLLGGTSGREPFEDYDEIIARYVEPVAANLRDVRATPKYLPLVIRDPGGALEAIGEHLARERSQTPARIAYCLTLARDHPGRVLLSWQPAKRPHHELIEVDPRGFGMRGRHFERIEQLIGWFKQEGASADEKAASTMERDRKESATQRRDESSHRRGNEPHRASRDTYRSSRH